MADRDLYELIEGNDKVLLDDDGDVWQGMRWSPRPAAPRLSERDYTLALVRAFMPMLTRKGKTCAP